VRSPLLKSDKRLPHLCMAILNQRSLPHIFKEFQRIPETIRPMRHVVLFAISHTLYCTSFQAGRPITLVRADPLEMRRAILNPLAMGSRGRYVIVTGVQVPKFPPCLIFVFQWVEAAPGFCGMESMLHGDCEGLFSWRRTNDQRRACSSVCSAGSRAEWPLMRSSSCICR